MLTLADLFLGSWVDVALALQTPTASVAAANATASWWTAEQGAWVGAIGGSGLGLLGAIIGPAMGILTPKGKGKSVILPILLALGVAGFIVLCSGLIALAQSQPYHVWYPLMLLGLISSTVMLPLFFVARARYRAAEHNRMQAQDLLR